jgi:hypothetical protein
MKKLIAITVILILLISCKKGILDNQLRILIRNNTDSSMTVKVYAKREYVKTTFYAYSDILKIYKDTTFIADKRLGSELYITDSMEVEPQQLLTRVFDSIHIQLPSGRKLRFSPRMAVNYSHNPFTERSVWVFEKNSFHQEKMWRENNIESDDYIFVLSGLN